VERAWDELDANPVIVAGRDVPMPYNRTLESLVIPSEERLKNAILSLMDQA